MKGFEKMKNKTAIFILTLCTALLSLSNATLADEESNSLITNNNIEIIPVNGYIGPETDVIISASEIYVEVPAKILFAAFENDGGTITSPIFKITNLSTTNDIKVEIQNFQQRNEPDISLEGNLSLNLLNDSNENLISDLFPFSYSTEKLLCERLPKYEEESDRNRLAFTIGGIWSGAFDNKLYPQFDITIKFSTIE